MPKSLALPKGGITCWRSERSVWQESKLESLDLASDCRGCYFPKEALDHAQHFQMDGQNISETTLGPSS